MLRGLFAVLFGIVVFDLMGSVEGSALLFGTYFLVDGVFVITAALVSRPRGTPWWALLVEGLIGVAVGIMQLAWPGISGETGYYLLAGWAVATGPFEVVAALRLRKEIRGKWLLALRGILSVLFGMALAQVGWENRGPWGASKVVKSYAIASGVLLIAFGIWLRGEWLRLRATGAAVRRAVHGPSGP